MRQDRIIQASIFDLFSEHEIGRELKAMSAWLDAHREVIALVAVNGGAKRDHFGGVRRDRLAAAGLSP